MRGVNGGDFMKYFFTFIIIVLIFLIALISIKLFKEIKFLKKDIKSKKFYDYLYENDEESE